jgi:O-methyltransferase involved in polyketide biosynthesis
VYVEIDFKREALLDVLRRGGYQPGEKTFFIWEGVSMYLPEASVRETLRAIASDSAPGSRLVKSFWKALPFIWKMLARRATWYAVAELKVPQR